MKKETDKDTNEQWTHKGRKEIKEEFKETMRKRKTGRSLREK